MKPDYGRTALDYARHRAPFPGELFSRLAAHGIGLAGQRILDEGCGTGALARVFAQRGCVVTGLDPSVELLAEAKRLDAEVGVSSTYVLARAEDTGLPDSSFDAVTAGVCWHWFDGDRAAREVLRVLAPGGQLAIVHFDWLSAPGNLVEATERLIKRYGASRWRRKFSDAAVSFLGQLKPVWRRSLGVGIHPDRMRTLADAGFDDIQTFSFDTNVIYDRESWRGRVRSHADVGARLSPRRVAVIDRQLGELLATRFPQPTLDVLHRVFVVIGRGNDSPA